VCVVATRGKQHSYARGHMLCLHYTLCLMQLSGVRNLILMGCSDDIPVSGLVVIDAVRWLTRVNSANVLDEGLRIGEIGRRMNSKVKLVEISVYRK
jgi:hypothetical protein